MNLRKLTLLVMALALLAAASPSFAMPSDADLNTDKMTKLFPEPFRLESIGVPFFQTLGLGATGDYVVDRTLDDGSNLDETVWYGGNVYWGPVEKLQLSVFLGTAKLHMGNVKINNDDTTRVNLKTEGGDFAFGVGGKVDILEFPFPVFTNLPSLQLFGSGGYRHAASSVTAVTGGVFDAASHSLDIEVNEWQASLGLSQRWDNPLSFIGWNGSSIVPNGFSIVPYVALQYSDVDVNISGTSILPNDALRPREAVETGHKNSDNMIGVATGLQLLGLFNNQLVVGVEGRFITETAVSVNGKIRW